MMTNGYSGGKLEKKLVGKELKMIYNKVRMHLGESLNYSNMNDELLEKRYNGNSLPKFLIEIVFKTQSPFLLFQEPLTRLFVTRDNVHNICK